MTTEKPRISDEAVRKATGRTWNQWEEQLDSWNAEDLSHREIVALLRERTDIGSGWWRQMVSIGYEQLKGRRKTGETAGAGFEVGVQRTVPIPAAEAWRLVTSAQGVEAWLGRVAGLELEEGETYRLSDGSAGKVRVVRPERHLRITWHPQSWPRPSTIQVRTVDKGDRSVIAFHQEHLPGAKEREERRAHFRAALDRLEELAG